MHTAPREGKSAPRSVDEESIENASSRKCQNASLSPQDGNKMRGDAPRQQGEAEGSTGLNLKEVQPTSYRTLWRTVCTSWRKAVSSSTVGSRLAASTQSSRKAPKRWIECQISPS